MNEGTIRIKDIINILRKKLWLIILCVVVCTSLSCAYTFLKIQPLYSASTKLFIGKLDEKGETVVSAGSGDMQYYKSLANTYTELYTKELVKNALDGKDIGMSYSQVYRSVSINSTSESPFLTFTIIGPDPKNIVKTLNLVVDEFKKESLAFISHANFKVIEPPEVPTGPFNINHNKYIFFGLAGGLCIGIALVLALAYFDNTIKSKDDIENILGVAVIGTIPLYSDNTIKKEKKKLRHMNKKLHKEGLNNAKYVR